MATISQSGGDFNDASINQTVTAGNMASIVQTGSYNSATVNQ